MEFNSLDSFYRRSLKTLQTVGLVAILGSFCTNPIAVGQLKQQNPAYTPSAHLADLKQQTVQTTEISPDETIIFSKEYLAQLELNLRSLEYNSQLTQVNNNNFLKVDQMRDIRSPLQIETSVPKFNSKGDAGRYAGQAVADKIGFAMPYINAPLGNGWHVGSDASESQLKLSAGLRGLYQPLLKIDYRNAISSGFDAKLRSRWDKPVELSIVKRLGREKKGELPNEIGIYTDLEKSGDINTYIIFQSDWNWFKNKLPSSK